MESLIKKIVDQQLPCYFISPHLDDAVLSAGGLITRLAGLTKVTVITVFTQISPPPYTLSIRQFLKQCGSPYAKSFYAARRKEDIRVMQQAGVDYRHLDYVEALWRKLSYPNLFARLVGRIIPEFLYVYPIYRIHITSGRVSPQDAELAKSLRKDLHKLIKQDPNAVVFMPIGVGKNVDHILVRDACTKTFSNSIYWSDVPYNLRIKADPKYIKTHGLEEYEYRENLAIKNELIKGYATQWRALFPSQEIPPLVEHYYAKK